MAGERAKLSATEKEEQAGGGGGAGRGLCRWSGSRASWAGRAVLVRKGTAGRTGPQGKDGPGWERLEDKLAGRVEALGWVWLAGLLDVSWV